MTPEQFPTPNEMAQMEKERVLSDAEFLKHGAEFKFDDDGQKRLELTPEQVKLARDEMEKITDDEYENREEISFIETAKGSVYNYLPDGRTRRYKRVENKYYEPQDAIVFIPDYEWVSKSATKDILGRLGENEVQYEQTMLEYAQMKGYKIYIVDQGGNKLETNKQIQNAKGPVFLWFGHREAPAGEEEKLTQDFSIPVSSKPREGYYTFDTRKYKSEDKTMRDVHIGNKVVRIVRK